MTPKWGVMCTITRDADGERGSRFGLLRSSKDVDSKFRFKRMDDDSDANCRVAELCNVGWEVD
jgi:hypothetical protein